MDQSLNAHVKLDVASDVIRIDVRGSLSQASRPALMQLIQRIRRGGINSHIRVDLATPNSWNHPPWPACATTSTPLTADQASSKWPGP